eukprot:TRINITY_DN65_c0_g1_i2.p1 TRINITY_DN65_c0_g1~~TRINITY_DN65_c0_g1_i2.p1  ORF type:complete len:468 (+),score=168.66 TRINITY_DN65_c0_g1_i2:141-1544(+)
MVAAAACAALLSVLLASRTATANLLDGQCVAAGDYDAATDYFPDKVAINYAKQFTVTYHKNYKTVTNLNAGLTYVLYQCGTPDPALAVDGTFAVPITRLALGDTTWINRIEQLGERTSIVAFGTDPAYVSSPCLKVMLADNMTADAYNQNTYCNQNPYWDNAALEAAGVNVTFNGDASNSSPRKVCGSDPTSAPLYHAVVFSDTADAAEDALGQAEWIKFAALFYNREAQANAVFNGMASRYGCTAANAVTCSEVLPPPSVSYSPGYYQGGWYPNDADAYYAVSIDAAGGTFVLCNDTSGGVSTSSGMPYVSNETFVECNKAADVCIFGTCWDTIYPAQAAWLDQLVCVTNKRVYDTCGNGDHDWFESRVSNPDVLLEDFVMAIHNDNTLFGIGAHQRVWLRDVFTETIPPDAGACPNVTAPVVSAANECVSVLAPECVASAAPPRAAAAALSAAAAAVFALAFAFA